VAENEAEFHASANRLRSFQSNPQTYAKTHQKRRGEQKKINYTTYKYKR